MVVKENCNSDMKRKIAKKGGASAIINDCHNASNRQFELLCSG